MNNCCIGIKRGLIGIILGVAFSILLPSGVHAEDIDSLLPERSKDDIIQHWNMWMEDQTHISESIFLEEPDATSLYRPGKLNANYEQKGVDAANFYRYVVGLPGDLIADPTLVESAQYGAALLTTYGSLSHTPPQPSGMPKDFYDRGYKSTSSSNLFMMNRSDINMVRQSVEAYMNDSDPSNIDRVGHRRWILNPQMSKTGFGLAHNDKWWFSAMQVFDTSRVEKVNYNFTAYPSKGWFPVEAFGTGHAWSVQLNPSQFQRPNLSEVSVELIRKRDSKKWVFDQTVRNTEYPQAYFNVETSGFGSGYAIIFRPDQIQHLFGDDSFTVHISGLKKTDGTSATIQYTTNFFKIKPTEDLDELYSGKTQAIFQLTDKKTGKALPGIRLILKSKDSKVYPFENAVVSDQDGVIRIHDLPKGLYYAYFVGDRYDGRGTGYPINVEDPAQVIKTASSYGRVNKIILERDQVTGRIQSDSIPASQIRIALNSSAGSDRYTELDEHGLIHFRNLTLGTSYGINLQVNGRLINVGGFTYKGEPLELPDIRLDTWLYPDGTAKYKDLNGHWAESVVRTAILNHMVEGYENGKFSPDQNLTQSEFLAMLWKTFLGPVSAPGGGHWAEGYYAAARKIGIPVGMNQDEYDTPITRLQVAEFIAAAAGEPKKGDAAILYVLQKKYASGKEGDSVQGYQGADSLTRAEAVQFMFNLIEQKLVISKK